MAAIMSCFLPWGKLQSNSSSGNKLGPFYQVYQMEDDRGPTVVVSYKIVPFHFDFLLSIPDSKNTSPCTFPLVHGRSIPNSYFSFRWDHLMVQSAKELKASDTLNK